jgi:hypothetical protein
MSYRHPDTAAPLRPGAAPLDGSDVDAAEAQLNLQARLLYLRSYLLMRAAIGFIGVALPVGLLLGDGFLFMGVRPARSSLSAYYYSGMRDVFVGSLCAVGVFLLTYKVFEHNLDNTLSIIAGTAAIGVALFSTNRPEGSDIALTPLQKLLGELTVTAVHYVCATVFILSLAVITFFFGVREGRRPQQRAGHRASRSPTFWRRFHWSCAAAIVLSVAFIAVSALTGWFTSYSLIIGETAAILAFGLSWLMKGLELDILLGPPDAGPAVESEPAANLA